ncbi:alkaline phosphatase D family protein [Bowmanella pacifica]|uniref:alkaline phosphatase D family protein n=1 Tax=Bowmanella pacifica TaxID=502051 RepID=UPI001E62606F|nr:alkaline phosphatase D family protein [Bowmanella pacifica]
MQRRDFLKIGLATAGIISSPVVFSLSADPQRPRLLTGISAGDVSYDGAVIWGRTDRPALMQVEVSADETFATATKFIGGTALAPNDFNAKTLLNGLLPGRTWYYRVSFDSLEKPGAVSDIWQGQFKTAPMDKRDVRFCWSGDTAGQGFGIDTHRGGMQTYAAILRQQPDFFVHCGDLIYADNPIDATKSLADGSQWVNLQTEGVSKVAETLQEFRERYYYNYLDEHVSAFHRQVATFQQWDDHEVRNNWYPGEILDDKRYQQKSISLLSEYARRAMMECNPIRLNGQDERQIYRKISYGPHLDLFMLDMRSYRAANSLNRQTEEGPQTAFLGEKQLHWLKQNLSASKATWKIIAADMPIGLKVTDWGTDIAENMANIDGPPLGRELEMAGLLTHIRQGEIQNVHFITADVHYCASHYYDPSKAQFKDFIPFWEFVSGPLHAGTFGPNPFDNTFGPQLVFKGIPEDLQPGAEPSQGYQFFGQMHINGEDGKLTVSHFNRDGKLLWETSLSPA